MTSIIASVLGAFVALTLLGVVFELIRRHRLQERYALLWIVASVVLFVLSVSPTLLEAMAATLGIVYAPALLFAVTTVFAIVMLLHYSTVLSRLVSRNTELAQAVALLEERIRRLERGRSVSDDSE